jgi:hypothetical protein
LLISACNTAQLKYEVPEVWDGRLLNDCSGFFINNKTMEEAFLSPEDMVGFRVVGPMGERELRAFITQIVNDNIALSNCRNRECILKVLEGR